MSILSVTRYSTIKSITLVFLVCLFAACAGQTDTMQTDHAKNRVSQQEENMRVLTDKDNKRNVEIHVGQHIAVQLSENATTGFTWAVDEMDRKRLALENSNYANPDETGFIGAPGTRTFVFTARQPGELTLSFKYWRFWEGNGSISKRFTVQLRIVP